MVGFARSAADPGARHTRCIAVTWPFWSQVYFVCCWRKGILKFLLVSHTQHKFIYIYWNTLTHNTPPTRLTSIDVLCVCVKILYSLPCIWLCTRVLLWRGWWLVVSSFSSLNGPFLLYTHTLSPSLPLSTLPKSNCLLIWESILSYDYTTQPVADTADASDDEDIESNYDCDEEAAAERPKRKRVSCCIAVLMTIGLQVFVQHIVCWFVLALSL